MTTQAQDTIGRSEREFYEYWQARFPKLLYVLFRFAIENKFRLLSINDVI